MKLFGRRRIGAKPRELVSQTTLDNAFERRTFVIGAGMGGIGAILATRMAYIAIAENERWVLESESNRVNLSLIPPRRGWILDRNGAPLPLATHLGDRPWWGAVHIRHRLGNHIAHPCF